MHDTVFNSVQKSETESDSSEKTKSKDDYIAYCIYCGYRLEKDNMLCPNCGRILKNN